MKTARWPLLLMLTVTVLVGCGSSEADSPTASTPTVVPTETVPAAEPTPTEVGRSGGIAIRVLSVRTSQTVRYVGGTQSDITPNAEPKTVRAPQRGHYVYVKTRVSNSAQVGLDLTCGFPMEVALVDAQSKQYEPIDGLEQIAGNPACNAELQPSFKDRITWIFLVSPRTQVDSFAFADTTDLEDPAEPAQIALEVRGP